MNIIRLAIFVTGILVLIADNSFIQAGENNKGSIQLYSIQDVMKIKYAWPLAVASVLSQAASTQLEYSYPELLQQAKTKYLKALIDMVSPSTLGYLSYKHWVQNKRKFESLMLALVALILGAYRLTPLVQRTHGS